MSISSDPGSAPVDADDIPPVTVFRRMSEGGLRKESVEEVVVGSIVGLSEVDYQSAHKMLTKLINEHKELYNIVHTAHNPKKCRCRTTKVYQKILEELGTSRPRIVYCFLTSLVLLNLHNVDWTARKMLLSGDLSFLKLYTDNTPRSR